MFSPSLFADRVVVSSIFRRKRTTFAVIISLLFLYSILRSFPIFLRTSTKQFDDLHGLLYMVSSTENLLPHDLDVGAPVPPSTWAPHETFKQDVWEKRFEQLQIDMPIIVFSKSYCPYSRRAKELLNRYALKPAPHIVEVDLREDSDTLKSLLYRLTGHATFPNVILRGRSLGGYDNLHELHDRGDLEDEFERAGVEVMGNVSDE